MLAANEHHGEADGTGNRRQKRSAILALWRVSRSRRATHRTVQSFYFHQARILTPDGVVEAGLSRLACAILSDEREVYTK